MQKSGHVIVTGASSGIGLAIAERCLADGWTVTGISRRSPQLATAAFAHVPCDLASETDTARCCDRLRPADAFVHAAGFMTTAPIASADVGDGNAMWRLHVGAAVQLAGSIVPAMADDGRIVLIGSRVAAGVAGRSQYAAVKAAQVGLARSWAAELIARRITVNVVAPGATDTPMLRDPSRQSSQPKLPPLGRLIRPEEVAAAVAYLLGPMAAPITGQTLVMCGGASL
jgi:3-oxoacyl-[acyl-carrier protein] reductase